MYNFEPEKPLRLAKFYGIGGIFNLAILQLFTEPSNLTIKKAAIQIIYHHQENTTMDKQFERIREILGKNLERNQKNLIKYHTYLKKVIKMPCILTGIEDFSWEEPYLLGGWDQKEYKKLKKTNPSFTDQFELLEFLPVDSHKEDIIVKVKRLSDQKIFEIGLSWLECTDFKDKNYQFIHDYAVWHTNC